MEKIYIKTHGCSTNFSESEVMAGVLEKNGFRIVDEPESADLIIVNVCTVKGEVKGLRTIRKMKENYPSKKLIVAGCITKKLIPEIRKISEEASLISTHNIMDIKEVVEEALNENPVEDLGKGKEIELKINKPKKRINPFIGIVPISSGCNQYCAYCSVIMIKGKLINYPEDIIIKEVEKCVSDGCKEIWITSQDNGNYGLDKIGKNEADIKGKLKLPELLRKVIGVNGDFIVRIGMMNPTFLKEMIPEMIEIFRHKKVFKFLHVPVQSGSDEILRKMDRNYNVDDFKKIIEEFRKAIPELTLITDIIVGFPGETEEQFQESIRLIKEVRPDALNISRYKEREGTKANRYGEKVEGGLIKERSLKMTQIYEYIAYEQNKKWKNWEGIIFIDEKGREGTNTMIGRNYAYKPVIMLGDHKIGEKIKVRIKDVTKYDLRGEIISYTEQ
ncbi:MAG: tRNA (N(6)-L-threonylcarbamoyladenosine(37)-C(2))-methylthiotransferase [Candidatus Woesearchaeota archaeon]